MDLVRRWLTLRMDDRNWKSGLLAGNYVRRAEGLAGLGAANAFSNGREVERFVVRRCNAPMVDLASLSAALLADEVLAKSGCFGVKIADKDK